MALRPPQYRSDAPIIYVHERDDAWDEARVQAEQAEMRKNDQDPKQHPVARYLGGFTRYDLDPVREYLDESKRPTFWHLRRLELHEWYEVQPEWEHKARAEKRPMQVYLRCCALGLVKVENGPTLELPGGRPSIDDLKRLFAWGHDMPHDIGKAVYQASMPLDVDGAEGKPSG